MNTISRKVALKTLGTILLLLVTFEAKADYVTLSLSSTNIGPFVITTNYDVPSNIVAQIMYTFSKPSPGYYGSAIYGQVGNGGNFDVNASAIITGPARIQLLLSANPGFGNSYPVVCTIQTSPGSTSGTF